ncbi:conserved hypothetical protein [Dickeya parazeae Ech586]|uniref:Flavinylation-associated cytochrome domain-containing protein n=2 Tax=Dickeya TaxID=204037 RepID=D2BST1_DICZ5|nr:conserved hypothetical protein [Dickeya parazeae Ech586]
MKKIYFLQVILDVGMALLLLVLMGFHLHGEIIHEWSGILLTLMIFFHLYLNRHRLWTLPPTLPSAMRFINRVINIVTLMVILIAIVSGVMLSRHIFSDFSFHNPSTWIRKLHMTAVYWGMIIIAIHIGLHWKMLAKFFCLVLKIPEHSYFANIIIPCVFSAISVLGLYWFLSTDYLSYLLMAVDFSFFDYDESAFIYYSRYFSIIILFSLATRFLLWLFIFRALKIEP